MGLAANIAVQAAAILLFAFGIAEFLNLVRGSFVLRRIALAGRQNYTAVLLKSPMVPPVSTIAIPPDASPESVQFARRLLELHYGRNEVVIVLDGPSDAEKAVWHEEFHLCPSARVIGKKLPTAPVRGVYESRDPIRVVVIDKEKGGAVDAWNTAVNACTSPVIGILNPGSDVQPDILLRLIQPMIEAFDETIAISGGVPAPPGTGLISRFGALESLRAWMTRGAVLSESNKTLPFPGSAVLVKRSAVLQAGGFTGGPLELFVRLHGLSMAAGKPYRILFIPEAVSQSRTPATLADLRRQVNADQREIAQAFFRRVAAAGPFGWRVMRSLFYARALRPWLETVGLILAIAGLVVGWVGAATVLLLLLATVAMGIVLSMAAVVLREFAEPNSPDDRRMSSLFFAAIPENLGYRQLRNLWLIAGFRSFGRLEKPNRGKTSEDRPPAVSAASGSV
jgi:cellulose synthase/poly-beta-1,6-N-acetylglucosamine synthase-like glycosyltransferase